MKREKADRIHSRRLFRNIRRVGDLTGILAVIATVLFAARVWFQ